MPGSTPCVNRLSPSVTRQTLPVRSPLPNRQPSTRSRAGHQRELGRGDAAAAIVVRMHRQRRCESRRARCRAHPLDLVGVDVGRRHLDRRRQVDDHPVRGRRLPDVDDRVADLDGEVELGAGEALRRVLEDPVGVRESPRAHSRIELRARRTAMSRMPCAVEPEHDAALRRRRRVVEVHDRALRARERLERAPDQRLARLRQHLDGDVVGDQVPRRSACARSRSRSARPRGSRPRSPCSPCCTSSRNIRSLRSASIGSISAWLPSRRSTLHHTGGVRDRASTATAGREGRSGANGRYLADGSMFMVALG